VIKALRRILHDHEVVSTVSAREALAQLETDDRFDVILCDLMMPTMTGMDFYEELLRLRPGGALSLRATAGEQASPER
jgi:CheY-like chemotaxis protein